MDNVRLLKNLYDAFGHGDIPTVLGSMSPDIRWHQAESNPYMPSGDAWVGPDAVLNNMFMKLVRRVGRLHCPPQIIPRRRRQHHRRSTLQRKVQGDGQPPSAPAESLAW